MEMKFTLYRKNPAHITEYSHNFSDDKDDDKDSGEDDDRSACPYGTACYRWWCLWQLH